MLSFKFPRENIVLLVVILVAVSTIFHTSDCIQSSAVAFAFKQKLPRSKRLTGNAVWGHTVVYFEVTTRVNSVSASIFEQYRLHSDNEARRR